MRVAVTALLTAAVCFSIAAGESFGFHHATTRKITLRPGDTIAMREIAWSCRYVNAPAGTVLSCSPTGRGQVATPLVALSQAHAEVFGHAPSVARVPNGGGFYTFPVK
jgi:hypothetical protein